MYKCYGDERFCVFSDLMIVEICTLKGRKA